jgi:hypothetical protein
LGGNERGREQQTGNPKLGVAQYGREKPDYINGAKYYTGVRHQCVPETLSNYDAQEVISIVEISIER